MKTLLFALSFLSLNTFANVETVDRVIHDRVIKTNLLLDNTTVRCSDLGYGNSQLKISVPDLDYHTFFDHSNIGEALPCMTAGMCEMKFGDEVIMPGHNPSDIIDVLKPREDMEIRIVLKEQIQMNRSNNSCFRAIVETLEGELRGLTFTHYRSKSIGSLSIEACEEIIK